MTPVIPHGLTPATQEHYLQSYAFRIQPKKLPEANEVNSVLSKVMMMMTMMMISTTTNHPAIIATLLMKVMTPFLIFPTMIITSMTTCHQISFTKKMNKLIPCLKAKAILHLKGKVDLTKKLIPHLKGMVDLAKKPIPHLKVQMDLTLLPVDLMTPIQALSFLQMTNLNSRQMIPKDRTPLHFNMSFLSNYEVCKRPTHLEV
jgi:hypothetical protein